MSRSALACFWGRVAWLGLGLLGWAAILVVAGSGRGTRHAAAGARLRIQTLWRKARRSFGAYAVAVMAGPAAAAKAPT